MRGDYDNVEDPEINKKRSIENNRNRFLKGIIIVLIFILVCFLCFKLFYLLAYNKIENSNELKSDASDKIYIIEQKLRIDLEKMNSTKK
jgi:uncharacterized protein YpmB